MNHTSPITAELPNSMVCLSNINSIADHSQGQKFLINQIATYIKERSRGLLPHFSQSKIYVISVYCAQGAVLGAGGGGGIFNEIRPDPNPQGKETPISRCCCEDCMQLPSTVSDTYLVMGKWSLLSLLVM